FDGFKQRQRAEDLRRRLTAAARDQGPAGAPAPEESPQPAGTAAPAEAPSPAAPAVEPPAQAGPTPAAGTGDSASSPPRP
ncbi:MAG TPA: hypothetical protein VFX28_15895, partial [Methylomirabilota bacterium]|nr:hypothetical protein [Methylomirabilota bacterium]